MLTVWSGLLNTYITNSFQEKDTVTTIVAPSEKNPADEEAVTTTTTEKIIQKSSTPNETEISFSDQWRFTASRDIDQNMSYHYTANVIIVFLIGMLNRLVSAKHILKLQQNYITEYWTKQNELKSHKWNNSEQ